MITHTKIDPNSSTRPLTWCFKSGRYWDRTSDLFGVNSRQRGLLESFAHVRRFLGWCCGPLGVPRLLYFAAVQLWTAAGGGLPCAVCRDRRRTVVSYWRREALGRKG